MDKKSRCTVLITGGAGFIGYHLTKHVIENYPDMSVVSIDNLNSYYDVELKRDRIARLKENGNDQLLFLELDITDREGIEELFKKHRFTHVVHLAAQAGVRYARENPDSYIKSNIEGFYSVISTAAKADTKAFVYASSSSVYGANKNMPFKETDLCSTPMSLYAATKISNEMLAASYFYAHNFRTIGMRFFNVYGPWGRPDMAYFKWTEALTKGEAVELRDKGEMYRDMTYVDDVVEAIIRLTFSLEWEEITHETVNIGNTQPVKIIDVLKFIMEDLEIRDANIQQTPRGLEEPVKTFADTTKLKDMTGFAPNTDYKIGLKQFLSWYREYKDV